MKNQLVKILVMAFVLSSGAAVADFSERGMLPMDVQWWECRVGMVIKCHTEECPKICASKLAQEKEEKEMQRLENIREVVKQGTEEGMQEFQESNPPQ